MRIVHLVGCICSGKSYSYKALKDNSSVAYWDIDQFYQENKCYKDNGEMDWDIWHKVNKVIPAELNGFIKDNSTKKLLIVESGGSAKVAQVLSEHEHTRLEFEIPDEETLISRAKQQDKNIERVVDFSHIFAKKYAGNNTFTPDEIRVALNGIVNGINIGIIGSAGRGEDTNKMSKRLYFNMYRNISGYLKALGLQREDITLISGGAAWADHIAVSLFLAGQAKHLKLYLPCRFSGDRFFSEYYDDVVSKHTNRYHDNFSEVMKSDTRQGIANAINLGAETFIFDGFKDRNNKIAENSDLLIAHTWHNSKTPKPGSGTIYTWNKCNGVKRHFSLYKLEG